MRVVDRKCLKITINDYKKLLLKLWVQETGRSSRPTRTKNPQGSVEPCGFLLITASLFTDPLVQLGEATVSIEEAAYQVLRSHSGSERLRMPLTIPIAMKMVRMDEPP